ncbi:MAG: hypothetical protein K2G79_06040, partial [Muribaculum sp.]|nr:hypothetical protein [Muribaculum sp.]
ARTKVDIKKIGFYHQARLRTCRKFDGDLAGDYMRCSKMLTIRILLSYNKNIVKIIVKLFGEFKYMAYLCNVEGLKIYYTQLRQ